MGERKKRKGKKAYVNWTDGVETKRCRQQDEDSRKLRPPKNQHRRLVVVVAAQACLCRQRCVYDHTWIFSERTHMQTFLHFQLFYHRTQNVEGKETTMCCARWKNLLNALDLCSCAKKSIKSLQSEEVSSKQPI